MFLFSAPLTEPEVTVVETMYNRSLSAAGINAMCNLTKDQSNKTAQALGIQILNSTGDVILTNVDVTPYNVSTSSCGELVYISWIELFKYRADLNMSTLNCFLENSVSKKTVFSNNITLIFKDQQQPWHHSHLLYRVSGFLLLFPFTYLSLSLGPLYNSVCSWLGIFYRQGFVGST